MMPDDRPAALVSMMMKHQERCGDLEHSDDGKEITCAGCGVRIIKGEASAIVENKGYRLELF